MDTRERLDSFVAIAHTSRSFFDFALFAAFLGSAVPLFIPAIFFSSVSARACLSCRFCVGWTLAFVFEPTLLIWEPWIAWRTTTSHSYRYANELQPGSQVVRALVDLIQLPKVVGKLGVGLAHLALAGPERMCLILLTTLSRNEKRERELVTISGFHFL